MNEQQSLELAIREEVVLVPHQPSWSAAFQLERQHLLEVAPTQFVDLQHFGSTAIPGIPAKPIIDILAGVASMEIADSLAAPLLQFGYVTSAEFNASLIERRWYMRHAFGRRTHHLHIVIFDSSTWRRHLEFRDALRSNTKLAGEYAALKIQLASQHATDREAYTHAKTEFVLAVVGDA
jgi:GrpB-like predicted nucleotidyltransferase (UPF0157 family)